MLDNDTLIEVKNLKTYFYLREGVVSAVDGASFTIRRCKTLGVVGESGCGKSVTAQSIMQIVPKPGQIVDGEITLYLEGGSGDSGIRITDLKPQSAEMREIRGPIISMIFQEPMTSFSPVHSIGNQLAETIHLHQPNLKDASDEMVLEMMRHMGISNPERNITAYPHQLSGGMRQRAMIAMALMLQPSLLIADEPTTAVDVTTEAQILRLMRQMQAELGMAILFITHDLGVIAEMADDVVVMYLGRVVEYGDVRTIFREPKHPYLRALMQSIPRIGAKSGKRLAAIEGMVPNPLDIPSGCRFHPRCPEIIRGRCEHEVPREIPLGNGHMVACHLYDDRVSGEAMTVSRQSDPQHSIQPSQDPSTSQSDGANTDDVLLRVVDLEKHFPIQKGFLRRVVGHMRAVDGVEFTIKRGETFGLVGESGCGKTTTGRCVLRAIEPTSGEVFFDDEELGWVDIRKLDKARMKIFRRHTQMIFQDPYSSLNPRMTLLDIIGEPLVNNGIGGSQRNERVAELLEMVGLRPEYIHRYPHAFSGGQRQRIGIARALAMNPQFVVCDEPVSALDVSIQAQTLNLLQDLQESFGLTYLFIAHQLNVVEHICDRVAVMYVGKLVEMAETETLFHAPLHPYTEALMGAVPRPDPEQRGERTVLEGEIANPANPPSGCYFHPRCPYAVDQCAVEEPALREVRPDHYVKCHRAEELELIGVNIHQERS